MTKGTILALVIAVLALGVALVPLATGGGELGVTNFDDMTLSGDLVVGDDANVTGDLKIGNGSPSVTLNNEDAYVEGTFEVDGAARFDGAVALNGGVTGAINNDLNGNTLYIDPNQSANMAATVNGQITVTLPATGTLQVTTGNLRVGNGSNGTTLNGEDAYIEGTLEVDGVSNFAAQMTVLDDILVGSGTPTVTQNGGDIYASDQFEVDGEAQFDGTMDVNGAVDLDGAITNADGLEHIMFPTYATASFTYTASAGGTIPLFTVGASEEWIVHGVWLEVTTNFDCVGDDCVATIGDSNDVDGFCVLADAELQAADTEGTGWKAGWQCQVAATRGVYQDGTGGFIYDGSETIDVILSASGNDFSAGAATAHILYTRIN